MDQIESGSGDPETVFLKNEAEMWLRDAVTELPVEQKQVVLLRIFGEMPFKEIAELLKCPLNTVLGRMHYAVKNLRKMSNNAFEEASENGLSGI
jgi:RNA polymerase sigma-70 factor (ECF subfamily)